CNVVSIRCTFLSSFICCGFVFFCFFSLYQVYCPVNCGSGTRNKKIKEFLTFQYLCSSVIYILV
ncbi:mCG141156, partial [Mus musculus]